MQLDPTLLTSGAPCVLSLPVWNFTAGVQGSTRFKARAPRDIRSATGVPAVSPNSPQRAFHPKSSANPGTCSTNFAMRTAASSRTAAVNTSG